MEDINLGFFAGIPSNCFYWGAAAPQYKQFERKGGIHNHPSGQGFQTVRLITSQKFPAKNPRLISSILTFRDLHSRICRIFMRIARWENRVLMKSQKQFCQKVDKTYFTPKSKKMAWNVSGGSRRVQNWIRPFSGTARNGKIRHGQGWIRTGTDWHGPSLYFATIANNESQDLAVANSTCK